MSNLSTLGSNPPCLSWSTLGNNPPCSSWSNSQDPTPKRKRVDSFDHASTTAVSVTVSAELRQQWPNATFRGDDPVADLTKDLRHLRKEKARYLKEHHQKVDGIMRQLSRVDRSNRVVIEWERQTQERSQQARAQSVRDRKQAGSYGTTRRERQEAREEAHHEKVAKSIAYLGPEAFMDVYDY